jgi:hypothetical protein
MAGTTGITPLEGDVVELNMNGARLLMAEGNHLQESLLLFSKSLALLEESLSMKDSIGLVPFWSSTTAMDIQDTSEAGPYPKGGTSLTESNNSDINNTTRDSFWDLERGVPLLASEQLFIFHKPIEFFADDHLHCRGALLFNISLTQHALGLRTGNATTLQNAGLLYELAFQSFQSVLLYHNLLGIAVSDATKLQTQLYLLAAWNNQATIHLALHNRNYARNMLKQQKALILDLHQRHIKDATLHKSREEAGQVSQLLQAFLMNEFMVEVTSLSACVA